MPNNNYILTSSGSFVSEDELYHHGILGMKWGVRRYQNEDGSLTSAGRKRYSDDTDKSNSENNNTKRKGLTDKQKRAIKIGAAVAVTALAAYGGYKLIKSGKLDGLINRGKMTLDKGTGTTDALVDKIDKIDKSLIDSKTGLKMQSTQGSIADNLKKINPNYSKSDQSSFMNCGNCSIAFEARMRGYDVEALGNKQGMRVSQLGEFFKGFDENSFHTVDTFDVPKSGPGKAKAVSDAIKSTITSSYKDDARGTVFFTHSAGAHFFSWVKQGGEVKFYDAQNPDLDFDALFDKYKRYTGKQATAETKICRLDNLEINADNIKNVIKNSGDSSIGFHDSNFDAWKIKGEQFVTKYNTR